MEKSDGNVRGVVDSLTKVIEALDRAGIELIGENARSDSGGRGVRLKTVETRSIPRRDSGSVSLYPSDPPIVTN
jgi:hypothetical protein